MYGKCVHVDGIKVKRMIHMCTIGKHEFYRLAEDKEEWATKYILHNGHMFPFVGWRMDQLLEAMQSQDDVRNAVENFGEFIKRSFEDSLERGTQISLGVAQYLGRETEALAARQAAKERWEQRQAEAEKEKRRKAEEERQRHERTIAEAARAFAAGEKIAGSAFLELCARHGITLPLRTKGWAMRNLAEIGINGLSYSYVVGRSKKGSSVIWTYVRQLETALKAAQPA